MPHWNRIGGKDIRGSSYVRRRRRQWLWEAWSPKVTVGKESFHRLLLCFHCYKPLLQFEFEVDRFPICGHDGGTYRRSNIVPSCRLCNRNRCIECKKARDGN